VFHPQSEQQHNLYILFFPILNSDD
jgi:hypothetical protein